MNQEENSKNTDRSPKSKSKKTNMLPLGMSIGLTFGVAVGIATDRLAIGMCLGLAFGCAMGVAMTGAANKQPDKPE